jgi:hypothetical protein
VLHLDEGERRVLHQRLQEVLDEYQGTDDERQAQGHPPVGGLVVLHRVLPDDGGREDRPPA